MIECNNASFFALEKSSTTIPTTMGWTVKSEKSSFIFVIYAFRFCICRCRSSRSTGVSNLIFCFSWTGIVVFPSAGSPEPVAVSETHSHTWFFLNAWFVWNTFLVFGSSSSDYSSTDTLIFCFLTNSTPTFRNRVITEGDFEIIKKNFLVKPFCHARD